MPKILAAITKNRGVTLLSYALIVGLIAAVALVVVDRTGDGVSSLLRSVADQLDGSAVAQSGGGGGESPCNSNGETGCLATGGYVAALPASGTSGSDGQLAVTIPQGYHDGSTTATASDSDLVAGNIVSGVDLFGVTGTAVSCSPNQCIKSDGSCGTVRLNIGVVNHPANTGHCCSTTINNALPSVSYFTSSGTPFDDKGGRATWFCD
ncbi:MAG: hypothetical protein Alpg2KO_03960 [Alphaproteobacteria bacterium]